MHHIFSMPFKQNPKLPPFPTWFSTLQPTKPVEVAAWVWRVCRLCGAETQILEENLRVETSWN